MGARRSLLRSVAALTSAGLIACSLLVDTSDLANGPASVEEVHPEATADVVVDAPVDQAVVADAAPDADAGPATHPYVAAVLADGPVAYLRLEDAVGASTVGDEVAGPRGSVAAGAVLGVAGAFAGSRAAALDGSLGGIGLGSALSFAGTKPVTLELWFRPQKHDATYRFLASIYEDLDGGRESFGVYAQTTYGLVIERYVGGVLLNALAPLPSPGVNHHVVAAYDGSKLSLYVDGALVAGKTDVRSTPSQNPALTFGAFLDTSASVVGAVDELAVYDKALAPARVLAHYKASGR